jgi:Family of unknown function (DUF6152)
MRVLVPLRIVAALALWVTAVDAHHSIAGMYDQSRRVSFDGVISQFQFVNPHPFVVVDVTTAGGGTQSWKAELDNRWELVEVGVTPTTFKVGDRIVVSGSPGRDRTPILYVWRLERPADGFLYEQVGTSPRVSRLPR